MKTTNIIFLLLIAFSCFSCKTTYQLKAKGDRARLDLTDESDMQVELLSFQDEILYFQVGQQLYKTSLNEVKLIKIIEPYRAEGKTPMMFFLGASNAALGISMEVQEWGNGATKIAVWGMAVVAFANIVNPDYKFRPPLNQIKKDQLKLFCRYQHGLTEEQMNILLQHHGQKEFSLLNPRH